MVVFTCQHCGNSINKNKVEKHYTFECRNNPYVTCIDCLKDFRGDEYVAHTQCVTEEERYAPKGFVAKTPPSVKKRATWLNSVESSLETPGLTPAQKKLIQAVLEFPNVPQKKKKFVNFVNSAFAKRYSDMQLIDSVFNIMEETHKKNVEKEKAEKTDTVENNNKTNGCSPELAENVSNGHDVGNNETNNAEVEKDKKKKKKHKRSKSESDDLENTVTSDTLNNSSESVDVKLDNDDGELNKNGSNSNQKLSKKEKKEKKKRAKYEAELKDIEDNKKRDEEDVVEDEEVTNKKEKNKKKKTDKNVDENGVDNEVNCTNGKKNKNKRRNEENETNEPLKKKSKALDSEILNESINANDEEGKTFNWNEIIIKILQSRSDKELSVNRLCKKIINEYQAVYGDNHMTYEKLSSKFNKKLHKTPNVKVLKDKAKLMT